MEKVFFTQEHNSGSALKSVLKKALSLITENSEIKTIILLFPTWSLADSTMQNVLPSLTKGSRSAHCDNPPCGILVETLKNYSPSFQHILIPVYITEKELTKYEDEWDARMWVVVPSNYTTMENWLRVHSAENIDTGVSVEWSSALEERVINGIEWLWGTSFPNEGFIHPLDLNRLKCMANALAAKEVSLDYYSVLHYCITHKINHEGGRKIADYFVKAQSKRFKTDGNYPLSFMTEMMNTKHKRI